MRDKKLRVLKWLAAFAVVGIWAITLTGNFLAWTSWLTEPDASVRWAMRIALFLILVLVLVITFAVREIFKRK